MLVLVLRLTLKFMLLDVAQEKYCHW